MNKYGRDEAPDFSGGDGLVDFLTSLADNISLSANDPVAINIRTEPLKKENDNRKANRAIRNRETRQQRAEVDRPVPPRWS